MAVNNNRGETGIDLNRGGRGAAEAKRSDFPFLLRKVTGLADGLDMGHVTKRGTEDDPRFLVLFISRIFNSSSVF